MVKVHFRIYWTVCATMSRLPKHADAAQMPQLYSITKSRKLGLMQTGKSSSVAYTKKEHERRLTSVSTTTTLFMSANLLVPNGYCWLKICGTYCESSECISLLQSSNLSSVSQYFKATWDQPTRGKWIPHRIVWLKMSCRQHRRQEEWPLRACAKTVVDLTITAYYSLKNWRAYFKTDRTSPQKDGNSLFRDSSWFYSEAPNFFGSKCITTLLVWRLKKLPALNCTYSGSSSSSSSPSLRGSAVGHSTTWAAGEVMIQRRHLKCLSTWNAREKTTSTWWSSDNHAICLKLGN